MKKLFVLLTLLAAAATFAACFHGPDITVESAESYEDISFVDESISEISKPTVSKPTESKSNESKSDVSSKNTITLRQYEYYRTKQLKKLQRSIPKQQFVDDEVKLNDVSIFIFVYDILRIERTQVITSKAQLTSFMLENFKVNYLLPENGKDFEDYVAKATENYDDEYFKSHTLIYVYNPDTIEKSSRLDGMSIQGETLNVYVTKTTANVSFKIQDPLGSHAEYFYQTDKLGTIKEIKYCTKNYIIDDIDIQNNFIRGK